MKKLTYLVALLLVTSIQAQNLAGAWESVITDENGREVKIAVILTDKYQVATWYDNKTGEFIATNGGTWELNGSTVKELVEFDTRDSTRVGTTVTFEIRIEKDQVTIVESGDVFKRIDNGSPGALNGAWLMSGRKRNGEIQERNTDRPRKTMKILSGTRFQWIAYNTETKRFMGTGGGTYTTKDGKYTENIEFFSRDNTRVGAALEFNYEMIEGRWHHSGKSSKGQPMYELWSVREK